MKPQFVLKVRSLNLDAKLIFLEHLEKNARASLLAWLYNAEFLRRNPVNHARNVVLLDPVDTTMESASISHGIEQHVGGTDVSVAAPWLSRRCAAAVFS